MYICANQMEKSHYELQLGITSNGGVRSRTKVEIHNMFVSNDWPHVSLRNQIAWVRENVGPNVRVLRIRSNVRTHEVYTFRIADKSLAKVGE